MPDIVMGQPLSRTEAILQNMLGANNVLEPPMSREEYLLLQLLDHIGPSGDYYTKEEIDNMISAIEQEIDWKESVATFADLATTYPNPEAGWTATVLSDGRIYRYNGTAWIDIYGMIPLATSSVNGLMSSGKVIDLETVKTLLSGHSVGTDVPSDAKFTDTVYDDTAISGRVTAVEGLLGGHSVASDVPANAVFTDTVYDDTAISGRVTVVENLLDGHSVGKDVPSDAEFTDTVYDDTEVKADISDLDTRVTDLENQETDVNVSKTVTGNPINITDAADAPIVSGTVAFEPIQDLHGYDKPWAGCAGKNKLPLTVDSIKASNTGGTWSGNVYTFNGIVYTLLTDSGDNLIGIKVNGATTTRSYLIVGLLDDLIGESVIMNGCPSGGSTPYTGKGYSIFTGGVGVPQVYDTGNGNTFTVSENGGNVNININNVTMNNAIFYPMIRLATETDHTFEPYSNICPIEGYDDCELEVTGKNLFDQNNTTDITVPNGSTRNGAYISLPAGSYTVSVSTSTEYQLNARYKTNNSDTWLSATVTSSTPVSTFSLDSDGKVALYTNSGVVCSQVLNTMLEKGSTSTSYEPYQSTTYTIDLDGTRYGGKVDPVSGEMTVDRAIVKVDDSWSLNTYGGKNYLNKTVAGIDTSLVKDPICSMCEFGGYGSSSIFEDGKFYQSPNSAGDLYIQDSRYVTKSDFLAAYNNCEIVYYLANPQAVQLTPEQIRTLEGTNNISTNMTDMTLEYITGSYQPLVDLAEAERETYYESGGMFVDTSNVIVSLTAFTSELSYTATEDSFAFLYLVTRDTNNSPEVRIDGQLAYTNYYGSTIVGNSCFLPLKKGQTLTVTGVNQTVESQYCVYGVTYINKIIQPVVYSEEEREIGVWTDGKPLYQKTIFYECSNTSDVQTAFTFSDNEIVQDKSAYFCNSIGDKIDVTWANVHFWDYVFTNTKISVKRETQDQNWQTGVEFVCTIRYTKSTDTPGSGIWTPSGVPAVHYSTDEHVVGTWIDGKPLYKKTIYVASPTSGAYYSHGANNVDYIQITEISVTRNGSWSVGNYYFGNTDYFNCITDATRLFTEFAMTSCSDMHVTIQYTKSTD